jgi:type I restriction enzyme M protein
VPNADIAESGYNIAISSYVEQKDTRQAIDISSLNSEIAHIVSRQTEIRAQLDAVIADLESES